MNEDGSWEINFGAGNDQEIADALGIDVEAVQSIMRKLSDYGFDINLDEPVASLEELKSSAESAKEALDSMNDTTLDVLSHVLYSVYVYCWDSRSNYPVCTRHCSVGSGYTPVVPKLFDVSCVDTSVFYFQGSFCVHK